MDPSNLLSLPTDSLYKFMAISGLIILLISITLPLYIKKQFLFKLFELERDYSINERNVNKLETKLKYLKDLSQLQTEEEKVSLDDGIDKIEKETSEVFSITKHIGCEVKKYDICLIQL